METNVGTPAITVNFTAGLVTPSRVAVIFAVPIATAVAKPEESMVATVVLSLDQVT
jgi:hypothetical protein